MRTLQLKINGRVQGVFYRQFACKKAMELKVAGSIRNCPDGSVEAVLSGEDGAIKEMIEWCRQGPPSALVESIEIKKCAELITWQGLRILG